MRRWSTDNLGRRIVVGLTVEETAEFLELRKRSLNKVSNHQEGKRYLELHDKHEAARILVVVTEAEARQTSVRH